MSVKISKYKQLEREVCEALIAEGWSYDNARFATLTAGQLSAEMEHTEPVHPQLKRLRDLRASGLIDDRPAPRATSGTPFANAENEEDDG